MRQRPAITSISARFSQYTHSGSRMPWERWVYASSTASRTRRVVWASWVRAAAQARRSSSSVCTSGVAEVEEAGFEAVEEAGADAAAGGQVAGGGLVAEQRLVSQPYRVLRCAYRDAEGVLVPVDDLGGDGAPAGLYGAEVGLGEVGE